MERNHTTLRRMFTQPDKRLVLCGVLVLLGVAYLLAYQWSEPFYNNDETRHVMTGVYFRDVLHDAPVRNLREYTINYYLQYPALGLLVWPPFFYFVEGLLMSIFGTSIIVSKALIGLFAVMACVYLFKLVHKTHDTTRAALAVLIFGLCPMVFTLSHYVMLEIPTLALCLAATYHFVSFLDDERRRDLILAGLFSALAALTRFDAIYLLPLFLLLIAARKRWGLLKRKDVLVVAAVALCLVAPFYALSASDIGWVHFTSVTETPDPSDPNFFSLHRFLFYPAQLRAQVSVFVLIPALAAIIFVLRAGWRSNAWVYLALIIVVYLTFTPIGELQPRHAIYWIPAFALFAAEGVALAANLLRRAKLYVPLAACVLLGMVWVNSAKPLNYVRGYEEAARYVVNNSSTSPFTLFVGSLNGNFIYQLRRQDGARRLWVLRADKILYNILNLPGVQHKQLAAGEEEILNTIFRYDPEFILIEEAETVIVGGTEDQWRVDFEKQVRAVVENHPERFRVEKIVAVNSNEPGYRGATLKVFRNILRNENPERHLELELQMLRRSIGTEVR